MDTLPTEIMIFRELRESVLILSEENAAAVSRITRLVTYSFILPLAAKVNGVTTEDTGVAQGKTFHHQGH
jgi:uncharacterized membrane protein YadS